MTPYFVKEGYRIRETPEYHNADADGDVVWQPDVYRELGEMARLRRSRRLVDLGCGDGVKLAQFADEFELIGIDFGPNVEYCRQRFACGRWVEHDLDSAEPLPLDPEWLRGAVVVCADVIEHLRRPERLLRKIQSALNFADAALLSTPERDLTRGPDDCGPPSNPCHVREWTSAEFADLLGAEGFEDVVMGLTRSNDSATDERTILARLQ